MEEQPLLQACRTGLREIWCGLRLRIPAGKQCAGRFCPSPARHPLLAFPQSSPDQYLQHQTLTDLFLPGGSLATVRLGAVSSLPRSRSRILSSRNRRPRRFVRRHHLLLTARTRCPILIHLVLVVVQLSPKYLVGLVWGQDFFALRI